MKQKWVLILASFLTACNREVSSDSPREFAGKFIVAETKAWSTGNVDDLGLPLSRDIQCRKVLQDMCSEVMHSPAPMLSERQS